MTVIGQAMKHTLNMCKPGIGIPLANRTYNIGWNDITPGLNVYGEMIRATRNAAMNRAGMKFHRRRDLDLSAMGFGYAKGFINCAALTFSCHHNTLCHTRCTTFAKGIGRLRARHGRDIALKTRILAKPQRDCLPCTWSDDDTVLSRDIDDVHASRSWDYENWADCR